MLTDDQDDNSSLFVDFPLLLAIKLFTLYIYVGWERSTVVSMLVSDGVLFLSCARLVVVCVVKHPLSVSQLGQLSLPSVQGR